jgi:hypothetical protein
VQAPAFEFHVNVPEKVVDVVVPVTVPLALLAPAENHVPDTELPDWVRVMPNGSLIGAVRRSNRK